MAGFFMQWFTGAGYIVFAAETIDCFTTVIQSRHPAKNPEGPPDRTGRDDINISSKPATNVYNPEGVVLD
jgi:hypothetical protein